ncbi:hypothetical protein SAFG77S_04497 [Streptomyces afghaniensis]
MDRVKARFRELEALGAPVVRVGDAGHMAGLLQLPQLGAGFLGAEAAAVARRLGARVTLPAGSWPSTARASG